MAPRTPVPVPLRELLGLLLERAADARLEPEGAGDVAVTGVCLDSRSVQPGDLFAALPGARWHGARFAAQAHARGAAAILTDPAGLDLVSGTPAGRLPLLVLADPRHHLGHLSAQVYGRPADDLLVLGVTGTNGKTTTTWLLEAGLKEAGHRTGLIGTVATRIGDTELPSVRTTPEAPELHALLARMRSEGVTAVAMEVSSHALALGRVDGLVVDVAGFTQLGRDHLDLHGSEEAYFAAKAQLFDRAHAAAAVITVDDASGRRLADGCEVAVWRLGTRPDEPADGRGTGAAQVRAATRLAAGGHRVVLELPDDEGSESLMVEFTVRLPGDFNVANAALAVAMLARAGVDLHRAAAGITGASAVPGRMEPVAAGQPFTAVVDYAHTPDALAAALVALRPAPGGRRLVVFGCGGDRDRAKRPEMGRLAAEHADLVVVTDDNPRSEDPALIRAAVLAGAHVGRSQVVEIGDRRAAIAHAVAAAQPGDVVLVAGKGHETGQEAGGRVTPFDDRVELTQAVGDWLTAVSDLSPTHRGPDMPHRGSSGEDRDAVMPEEELP